MGRKRHDRLSWLFVFPKTPLHSLRIWSKHSGLNGNWPLLIPVYSIIDVKHLPCIHFESPWVPSHHSTGILCSCANTTCKWGSKNSKHTQRTILSAQTPLSHLTSLTKHKFKDKIITHFNMATAKHQTKWRALLSTGPFAAVQVTHPWSQPHPHHSLTSEACHYHSQMSLPKPRERK